MSSEIGLKKINTMFARWSEMRRTEQETHAAWESANTELWAAWQEAEYEQRERRARAEMRFESERRVRASGLPDRAAEAWERGLERWAAVEAVDTWLRSGKAFLLLLGSTGVGKTAATGTAIAMHGGLFVRAIGLARLSVFDREDKAHLLATHSTPLLVLDDLGAELLHDGWRPMLDELIDVRHGDRLPTVITSNLDAKTLRDRYGTRVMDRIRDDGLIAMCGDKSRRGGNA